MIAMVHPQSKTKVGIPSLAPLSAIMPGPGAVFHSPFGREVVACTAPRRTKEKAAPESKPPAGHPLGCSCCGSRLPKHLIWFGPLEECPKQDSFSQPRDMTYCLTSGQTSLGISGQHDCVVTLCSSFLLPSHPSFDMGTSESSLVCPRRR
jgi:hypothetical protein